MHDVLAFCGRAIVIVPLTLIWIAASVAALPVIAVVAIIKGPSIR